MDDWPEELSSTLDDAEIEAIHDAAIEAAQSALPWQAPKNPYPADSERHEIWAVAFRNAMAKEWH